MTDAHADRAMRFELTVEVPPDVVMGAFASSLAVKEWLADEARVDGREGGRLYLGWRSGYCASGVFQALEPAGRVSFSWRGPGDPADSSVEVTLEPVRGGVATRVALAHRGLGTDEAWLAARGAVQRIWSAGLENLASVLEEGADLRVYGRPMLGLAGGAEVTPELAADRGLTVQHGILLTDFVEGMGAANAGLRRGDVLVRFGDAEVSGWDSLTRELAAREVGETVTAVVVRGTERLEAGVTLLGRPRVEPPATADEASRILAEIDDRTIAALEDLLEGVPEATLARTPSFGGWSVRETLAHLVASERSLHMWIAARLNFDECEAWHSGEEVLLRSLDALHPTAGALLEELRRAKEQTRAMVAALPTEFLERRASYVALCDLALTGLQYHARAHVEQVAEAIADAG